MTDIMKATVSYKRIHKIAEIKCRDFLEAEFGESNIKLRNFKLNDFNQDTLQFMLKRNEPLQKILREEQERHDALISVMKTRYEEGSYKEGEHLGLIVFCSQLGAFLHISVEFLYAWLFKK